LGAVNRNKIVIAIKILHVLIITHADVITMEDDTSDEQQSYDEDMSDFNASVEANQIEKLRVIAMEAFPYDEDDDN